MTHTATAPHPRKLGWVSTTALAMGGSNQMVFLIGALIIGQGKIPGQGTAAVPLLIVGLALSWAALPGWTELVMMWPNRVGGIAATCGEAFSPYAPVLGNLTGVSYWWGWVPTCGLTALLSASAIGQWFLPGVSVTLLACAIIIVFVCVNFVGVLWAGRLAVVIASASASLAFLSALIPVFAGTVDWHQALSFQLDAPFGGAFGKLTSAMAGLYLVGFAAPAFEAAACHIGETIDWKKNFPRAMYASAGMATLYFLVLPIVWLGTIGPKGMTGDLAVTLGPTFAPLLGAAAKSAAIWFMMFNMFHGTLAPLTGVARTLSQLSEDGLLPEIFARKTSSDCPWVAIVITALFAIAFLLMGDPIWMIAAANFTYLIGIALPSVAVWLLRRDRPNMERPYRAPRGTITLGLAAACVWAIATILGFEQFGLPTVVFGLILAYSGSALYAFRKWSDQRKAGIRGVAHSLHVKLTGAMLLVLILDGAGYYMAVRSVTLVSGHQTALIAGLEDIFVAVAMLTITVGLVLPGMIAHSVTEVAVAADRLATGTMADFSRAMGALAGGDLDSALVRVEFVPVVSISRDEVGAMAKSFNTLQQQIAHAATGLGGAREGLRAARQELTDINANLEKRVVSRTAELEAAHRKLIESRSAGMAEVAIGVLHNIGNVLNSVNVSASLIDRRLRESKVKGLHRVVALLTGHRADFGRFILEDEKGKLLPEYLRTLSVHVQSEQEDLFAEIASLTKGIDHIKQIVSSQQSLARGASFIEDVEPIVIMEDALHINVESLGGVTIERNYDRTVVSIVADKHQILQILVNLIRNATRALDESDSAQKSLHVTVGPGVDQDHVLWRVQDTGLGIPAENLSRIFEYGFTTKADGRGGFGLHASALAATLMSGSLKAFSNGPGTGATFSLELPILPSSIRSKVPGNTAA